MPIFKDKTSTAIEICDKSVKIVQIPVSGTEPKINICVEKELSSQDPKEAAQQIKALLKGHNINNKEVMLVIPRHSVTTKVINLPSQDPSEIVEMAAFQAVRQIPYPKEEIIYGVNQLEVTAEGYTKAMLVICHKDMVERPISVLNECGLTVTKVTLSSLGLLNWFISNPALAKMSEVAPVILLECDTESTDITVIDKGKLIYTRGLTFGSGETGGYGNRLIEELSRTLATFEREFLVLKPKSAVFTGNIAELKGSKEDLARAMGIDIEFVDSPGEKVSFASLVGAAIGPHEVDLLPNRIKHVVSVKARKRELTVSLILVLALIILISFTLWNKVRQKEQSLAILEKRLKGISPAAARIEKMKTVVDLVKSQTGKNSEMLSVLNEFYKITPQSISLTLYKYEKGAVEVKGTAAALSEVFRFVKTIEDSEYFQNVEVRYAAKKKSSENESSVDFELFCPLSNTSRAAR